MGLLIDSDHLVSPYGGELVNLMVNSEKKEAIKEELHNLPSWDMSARQLCDLELLLTGAFSPLKGFMNKQDYLSVIKTMRLSNGLLWPIPIVFDIDEETAKKLKEGTRLVLRDSEGLFCAILHIEDIWEPDLFYEAEQVFQTTDSAHAGVRFLLGNRIEADHSHFLTSNSWYVGGRVEGLHLPVHYDFLSWRFSPTDLRHEFIRSQWRKIVSFQTRNPIHRAHFHLTLEAMKLSNANLLLHPVVGLTKHGDVDYYTRVRCYQSILSYYPQESVKLALLPLAMRMAGPREAILHAIIRQNYGCSHFIIGRDHATPEKSPQGHAWYSPFAAQELFKKYEKEMQIKMVPFDDIVYVEELKEYISASKVTRGIRPLFISGTELRARLATGKEIPNWFTFPEVVDELQKTYPARDKQGITIFFTGLSGSGKSTIAHILNIKLLELGKQFVTLLDGDVVRKYLSRELGFSKSDRNTNILRIGFVSQQITKNRGVAICAAIAPYEEARKEVRDMIKPYGGFILVYCSTSLEVCEKRDRKGLYLKAKNGLIPHFTGVSDPYEAPKEADVVIDTAQCTPEEAVEDILIFLRKEKYVL